MDILWDFHTPRWLGVPLLLAPKWLKKYLFVLQSHVNQTAEEVYPESACAPDLKSIFHFLVFLVPSDKKSDCLDTKFFEAHRIVQYL